MTTPKDVMSRHPHLQAGYDLNDPGDLQSYVLRVMADSELRRTLSHAEKLKRPEIAALVAFRWWAVPLFWALGLTGLARTWKLAQRGESRAVKVITGYVLFGDVFCPPSWRAR